MTDSAFKWSMWYKGEELDLVFSNSKDDVWFEFIRWKNFVCEKNYTDKNRIMFEQMGYSVEESSWWRSANVRSS